MAKKQYWCNKFGCWQERNLSANRVAVDSIRKNFRTRKFKLTEFVDALGIDRKTARNWLRSLRRDGFVNSKQDKDKKKIVGRTDYRWYRLSKKGFQKLPRKKGVKKEPKVIERIREVEKEIIIKKIVTPKIL